MKHFPDFTQSAKWRVQLSLWLSVESSKCLTNPSWFLNKKRKSCLNSCIQCYLKYVKMPFLGACQPLSCQLDLASMGVSESVLFTKCNPKFAFQEGKMMINHDKTSRSSTFRVPYFQIKPSLKRKMHVDKCIANMDKQEIWRSPIHGNADSPVFDGSFSSVPLNWVFTEVSAGVRSKSLWG